MPRSFRTILVQAGSLVLAGGLLYLALRGVDFGEVGEVLEQAHFWWLVPLIATMLLSHVARAWRWQALLDALPSAGPRPVSLKVAFYSVMIGYMVNNAAPRLGEPIRAANVAAHSRLRFSSVFGTVFAERILDVLVLALGLLITLPLLFVSQADQIATLIDRLWPEEVPMGLLMGLSGLAAGVGVLVLLLFRRYVLNSERTERGGWTDRALSALRAFKEGLVTLLHSPRRLFILATTALMWGCYTLMAYLPFFLLDMAAPYSLSLADAWVLMLFGAIGFAIPSPGGIGSFHFVTIQTLVYLFGVTASAAATYALFTHTTQLILFTAVGFLCLVLQGASVRSLRARAEAAQATPDGLPPATLAPHPAETDHGDPAS